MKLLNVVENDTENEPVNWANKPETKETYAKYLHTLKQLSAATHQTKLFTNKLLMLKPHIVMATSEDLLASMNVPEKHRMKLQVVYPHWWGIDAKTPNADKLWETVKYYAERAESARKLEAKYQRHANKLKKVMRAESFNNLKYKTQAQTIPSSQVPKRIHYTEKKYFNNPYWDRENVIGHYAGTVGHFDDFNVTERNKLSELNQALIRNGLPGMSIMYGSTVRVGKWAINRFVAFGADGKVIWKHIIGNAVYINGKKVSWSSVVGIHPEGQSYRQKIFEPVKQALGITT